MKIFDLDYEERFSDLSQQIVHLKNINDSLAEKREQYREFSNKNEIDFLSLETCIKMFERTVLIDVYTLSEQLVKNFYYHVLEKDAHTNNKINQFINNKINTEKFSPNVIYQEIEKNISSDILDGFKFIFSKNHSQTKVYNHLIKMRHQYAHTGHYNFDAEQFNAALSLISYIYIEFYMIIEKGEGYRTTYQNCFKDFKNLIIEIKKIVKKNSNNNNDSYNEMIKEKLNSLRSKARFIIVEYEQILSNCILFKSVYKDIKTISRLDFRKITNCIAIFDEVEQNLTRTIF